MPARNDALKDRLSRYREIKISVTGRKSGRTISIPVWFVLEDDKLYLAARAGFGYTVVQEHTEEPVVSARRARRRSETSSRSYRGCCRGFVRG